MIELAYRLVPAEDVEPGSMLATTKGRMTVAEVAKTVTGVRIVGPPERPNNRSRKLEVLYDRGAECVVIASPAELDSIEAVIVDVLAGDKPDDHPINAGGGSNTVLVAVEAFTWQVPLRGGSVPDGVIAEAKTVKDADATPTPRAPRKAGGARKRAKKAAPAAPAA